MHSGVRIMVTELAQLLVVMQSDAEVTSILRMPGEIDGDSGVHVTGRAADVVVKRWNRQYQDMTKLGPIIESFLNELHPRTDGKPSCLWHEGTGWHFHLQVAYDPSFTDLMGA